jgi:hypothetical protein
MRGLKAFFRGGIFMAPTTFQHFFSCRLPTRCLHNNKSRCQSDDHSDPQTQSQFRAKRDSSQPSAGVSFQQVRVLRHIKMPMKLTTSPSQATPASHSPLCGVYAMLINSNTYIHHTNPTRCCSPVNCSLFSSPKRYVALLLMILPLRQ